MKVAVLGGAGVRVPLLINGLAGAGLGIEEFALFDPDRPRLQAAKAAFVAAGAAQCGFCIPGMVIAITGLLEHNAKPTEADIRTALRPHLCRCGTHARVLAAARSLAGLEA